MKWLIFLTFLGLVIANQKNISNIKGIKNLSGSIDFTKNHPFHKQPGFMISIQNKGLTPQKITYIQNNKKDIIHLFIDKENNLEFILSPKANVVAFLDITPSMLMKLEKADSLILLNNIGRTKKIISKNDIQRVLELYKNSK